MGFVCRVCMYCLSNLGESDDDSHSGSDAEEQKLWEETQIGKGVKRRPGDQVGKLKMPCSLSKLLYFINILNAIFLKTFNQKVM